jgi:hypothetical protein
MQVKILWNRWVIFAGVGLYNDALSSAYRQTGFNSHELDASG